MMVVAKMSQVIKATILLHRGLAATWARNNPTLAYGEPGFEKDTNRLKIGDGITEWNLLPYLDENLAKFRRDDEENYADNFVPQDKELCFVDTINKGLRVKVGDGVTQWEDLPYMDEHIYEELAQKVSVSVDTDEEMLIFSI